MASLQIPNRKVKTVTTSSTCETDWDLWTACLFDQYASGCRTNPFVEITKRWLSSMPDMALVNTDALSRKTTALIGIDGVERFETFKNYTSGWDGANAQSLSHRSVAVMEYFINQFSDFRTTPSLFLTPNGNLELGWEDSTGQAIELEFYPDRIEFYIEALDKEDRIEISQPKLDWLISLLTEKNANEQSGMCEK